MSNELEMWTVYYNPTDFPGKYVARLFKGEKPTGLHTISDTLEELRAKLLRHNPGLARLNRFPADEAQIVEVWL